MPSTSVTFFDYLSYAVNLAVAGGWTIGVLRKNLGYRSVRKFFGSTAISIYLPLRVGENGRTMIANEDFIASSKLAEFLRRHRIQPEWHEVGPGTADFKGGSIVICGPKSSPVIRKALEKDPHYAFVSSETTWMIEDKSTGNRLQSPLDRTPSEEKDLAYVGRLKDRHGLDFLLIAGIHAIGSYGAIDFLTNPKKLKQLRHQVAERNFSTVLVTTFNAKTMTIHGSEILLPVKCF